MVKKINIHELINGNYAKKYRDHTYELYDFMKNRLNMHNTSWRVEQYSHFRSPIIHNIEKINVDNTEQSKIIEKLILSRALSPYSDNYIQVFNITGIENKLGNWHLLTRYDLLFAISNFFKNELVLTGLEYLEDLNGENYKSLSENKNNHSIILAYLEMCTINIRIFYPTTKLEDIIFYAKELGTTLDIDNLKKIDLTQ